MGKATDILKAARVSVEPFRPITTPEGPVERVLVRGRSAVAAWEALRDAAPQTGCWPLINGNVEDPDFQQEMQDVGTEHTVEGAIRYAGTIDPAEWLEKQKEELSGEFDDDPEGRAHFDGVVSKRLTWPKRPPKPTAWHASLLSFKRGWFNQVAISLVPTSAACETPAWMRFGGWNACPEPGVHVAMMRYWQERYGAEPVCMTFDILEFRISRPPMTPEAARALALEQYVYCSDIVDQGVETVDALAMTLWQAPTWYFWWD